MQLIIVSGRSGSGKTIALRVLEDLGFYCVDNLPLQLLPALIHCVNDYESVAVSVDVRNLPKDEDELADALDFLPGKIEAEFLFIDSSDEVLLRRYGETRRMHPLSKQESSLPDAIALEHKLLEPLVSRTTWHIDSSKLSVHELSEMVREHVLGHKDGQLILTFLSFGFKHGAPANADTVLDARILPNPHWEPELKALTGLDQPVINYLQEQPLVTKFIQQVGTFIDTWLPYFERSNRSYLTIAIGCTGGQHRSVYIAESLANRYSTKGHKVRVKHRELEK
ncbi:MULTISPECIES: RNase adapter RapZ [Gammaproteobacteria]|uniref:RNase adapter RapZ n=1 Tax=Gammaproteobacteria TaxID=1236 RepID=UPI000DD09FB6|nr:MULTISPECIES: RNase adapter RapZ [Gammaproteobacteria]RTE86355.1 RNase adapter RapZ [Aliidiomarina sp. B3213]TCZ91705.1 RNase adapter RapZ [Lysobacter sp. N42]